MSEKDEKNEILTNKGLILIGITSVAILIVGLILLALGYNEAFYSSNSGVRAIFQLITDTGDEMFYIILIAVFFIAYDKKFAKNLLFSLLITTYINNFLKDVFQDPRPPSNIDPSSETGYIAEGYGFPSGHSQSAIAIYGYAAYHFKDKSKPLVIPIIVSIYIFLIALSRLILGVHDLQDIIGGLLFGICVLIPFIYIEPIISEKLESSSLQLKMLLALIVSVLLLVIGTVIFPTSGQYPIKNPVPYADAGGYALVSGVILGFSIGYLFENEYVNYLPSELSNKQKIINLIVGLILVFVIYFVLGLVIRGNIILRFIRYALLAFSISLVLPIIFNKINRK
jgi:membrane-associated phospholipid phosphatase